MKIVSDTSPLIFLSKIRKLNLLDKYTIIIPDQVYAEIKIGKIKEKEDYVRIDNLIEKGKIIVKKTKTIKVPFTVGKGENEVVALAIEENADIVLIDDKKARKLAEFKNLKHRGTLAVIIQCYNEGEINYKELRVCFEHLLSAGFYISEDKLIHLLNTLERKK